MNTSHANCGWEKNEFWHNVICWEFVFETPRKLGKEAASSLFILEWVCRSYKGSIHSQSFWSLKKKKNQSWNSISSTFAVQRLPLAQEILSAHFLSVRKPHYAFSLPLMGPHANLPPPPTSLNSWDCQWTVPKCWKLVKHNFFRAQMFLISEETNKKKTYGSPYTGCLYIVAEVHRIATTARTAPESALFFFFQQGSPRKKHTIWDVSQKPIGPFLLRTPSLSVCFHMQTEPFRDEERGG